MDQPRGMTAFTIIWLGQVLSLLGSAMTAFALTIWAFEETGQATVLALVAFFSFGPTVLLSPVAGALVDRWNRRLVMMFSDLAAGLSTIVVLILFATGRLEVWHLYVTGAFAGAFQAFQFPAYSAAVTMMLSKEQYARASGMLSLAQSASGVLAPAAAGALLGPVGLVGILLVDVVTFVVAVGTLLFVHIPQPEATADDDGSDGGLWRESVYGFRYIYRRPSLLGLQMVFFFMNFISAFTLVLLSPMILARTGNDELLLGAVQSIGAIGGVVGGLVLSAWGGPRRRIHGVLLGMLGASLLGQIPLGIGRALLLWSAGNFAINFMIPILNGSNQAIWQAKVAPGVQGRVFAVRRLIAQITYPLATLAAGPLADHVFEPAMMPDGALVDAFGWLVGAGPGAGMGLIVVIAGCAGMVISLGGYLFPVIRNAETLLPDHEAATTAASQTAAAA